MNCMMTDVHRLAGWSRCLPRPPLIEYNYLFITSACIHLFIHLLLLVPPSLPSPPSETLLVFAYQHQAAASRAPSRAFSSSHELPNRRLRLIIMKPPAAPRGLLSVRSPSPNSGLNTAS